MLLPLCASVCGGGAQEMDNGCYLASGVSCRRKLSPGTCPDSRHFSFSPYATVLLQLLPWCWSPEGMSLHKSQDHCVPFKRRHLRILQFLPLPPPILVWGTYLPGTGTLGWEVRLGLGFLIPKVSLLIFIHHVWVRDHPFCVSVSPPLLPIWMNVTSIPWLSDFHTAQFSDISG